jgi:hypothetical protein
MTIMTPMHAIAIVVVVEEDVVAVAHKMMAQQVNQMRTQRIRKAKLAMHLLMKAVKAVLIAVAVAVVQPVKM